MKTVSTQDSTGPQPENRPRLTSIWSRSTTDSTRTVPGTPRNRLLAGGLAGAVMVTLIAWLYGVFPFSGRTFALPIVSSMSGWVECLQDGLRPCTYVGYPQGADLSVSTPLVGGVYLLTRAGLSVEVALNVLAFAALAAGFAAMWSLTAAVTRHTVAGVIGAALYYLSPLLVTHMDKTGLWLGFVLLPVPVALTYAALRGGPRSDRRRMVRAHWCAGLVLLGALLVVYLDPYAWTIATMLCGPMCVAAAAVALRRRSWPSLIVAAVVLLAIMVPGIIFRMAEPSAEAAAGFPLDFYRAFGADVVTAIVPTRDSLLWDVLRSPVRGWNPADFRGDGTHLLGAYLGVFSIVVAGVGAVYLLRRSDPDRPIMAALMVGGIACFALGLGPSLKLLDKWPEGATNGSVYRMPASEATATLPWSPIYGVQPFEGMRAAYRWHAGIHVVLAVFATAAVVVLLRQRWTAGRTVGVVVAALLLFDTTSQALVDARSHARRNHELHRALQDDISHEFGQGQLQPSERVLFLPADNDYLIMAIAPRLQVFAYNASFDKEVARVREHQPPPVLTVIAAYTEGELTRAQVCDLFRQDLVDAVVFNNFDMRGDSSDWPPDDRRVDAWRSRNLALGLFDDPAFDVDQGDLATVVRPAGGSPDGC